MDGGEVGRRELIERRLREGARNTEIAAELGISRERVRQLIIRDRPLTKLARSAERRAARWQRQAPRSMNAPTAKIVQWLTTRGVLISPSKHGEKRCFKIGRLDFCCHYAARPRQSKARGAVVYYHFTGCGRRRAYQVVILGDGRHFIVPPGTLGARQSHYIARDSDGDWTKYRDTWPFRLRPLAAVD